MSTRTRVFIAGLGQIGFGYDAHLRADQFVYSHARAFSSHPAFEVVGGCDPSVEARTAFSTMYGVPAWSGLDEVPDTIHVDLLVVSTPTRAHHDTVAHGLRRWMLTGVLCEKPLADDLETSTSIVTMASAAGVPLWVNYIRRADPGVIRVARMFSDGTITTPVTGVVWYSKGLIHNGSHLIDMVGTWLGGWVSATRLGAVRGTDVDVDIQFERGRAVALAAHEEHYSHYTVELVSPSGRLRYDLNGTVISWQPVVAHPTLPAYRVLSPTAVDVPSGLPRYQWHVASQLASALQGAAHPLATGEHALALQRHLSACLA